jgi:hypothetical protein
MQHVEMARLPKILRDTADKIEKSFERGQV